MKYNFKKSLSLRNQGGDFFVQFFCFFCKYYYIYHCLFDNLIIMPLVLDKTSKTVLLKLTIEEYKRINDSWIFDDDKIDNYEFIFNSPVKASDLLKTF